MDKQDYNLTKPANRRICYTPEKQNGNNREEVLRRIIPAMTCGEVVAQPLRPFDWADGVSL